MPAGAQRQRQDDVLHAGHAGSRGHAAAGAAGGACAQWTARLKQKSWPLEMCWGGWARSRRRRRWGLLCAQWTALSSSRVSLQNVLGRTRSCRRRSWGLLCAQWAAHPGSRIRLLLGSTRSCGRSRRGLAGGMLSRSTAGKICRMPRLPARTPGQRCLRSKRGSTPPIRFAQALCAVLRALCIPHMHASAVRSAKFGWHCWAPCCLQALCVCPTRELVVQNQMVLERMGKFTGAIRKGTDGCRGRRPPVGKAAEGACVGCSKHGNPCI